jgi:hypothetical protein
LKVVGDGSVFVYRHQVSVEDSAEEGSGSRSAPEDWPVFPMLETQRFQEGDELALTSNPLPLFGH